MVCVGVQSSRYYSEYTIDHATLPPHQLTNGVAYVVAAYQACIERGGAITRCRRDPEESASPDFVGCTVGMTRIGLVLGSGRPRSLAVSRVGLFFRGKVGRNLRLAGRSGAPRASRDDERRGAI